MPPLLKHISDVPLEELEGITHAFVDLDGTGLNKKKIPGAGFWSAVEAFEATGGVIVPATGNAREAAFVKVRNADASGTPLPADKGGNTFGSSGADLCRVPGIYQNGAEVRGKEGQEISKTWLDKDVLKSLLNWFHKLSEADRQEVGIAFQSYGDVYILEAPSDEVDVPSAWTAVRHDMPRVRLLEKWSRAPYYWGEGMAKALCYEELHAVLQDRNVHCAMVLTPASVQARWANDCLTFLGCLSKKVYHCTGLSDPEPYNRAAYTFTHLHATKGSGLKLLMADLQSQVAGHVVAFGDNLNDKTMFLVDGVLGIVVANAVDGLKEAAHAQTGPHDDPDMSGVAVALHRIAEARSAHSVDHLRGSQQEKATTALNVHGKRPRVDKMSTL
eukprot:TRINITY_DN102000_c0_g1_i1.p1 TRINITY_DN102000_c0_g1~~TRINITY_DN102000_c0_g1_i1.p1  ORF type:complete len:387 (-),score=51.98 TRINITY_DN102000_c0_g1_i1:506-1666(-)